MNAEKNNALTMDRKKTVFFFLLFSLFAMSLLKKIFFFETCIKARYITI